MVILRASSVSVSTPPDNSTNGSRCKPVIIPALRKSPDSVAPQGNPAIMELSTRRTTSNPTRITRTETLKLWEMMEGTHHPELFWKDDKNYAHLSGTRGFTSLVENLHVKNLPKAACPRPAGPMLGPLLRDKAKSREMGICIDMPMKPAMLFHKPQDRHRGIQWNSHLLRGSLPAVTSVTSIQV